MRLAAVALLIVPLLFACTTSTPTPTQTPHVEAEWTNYSVGGLSVSLPAAWDEITAEEERVIHVIGDGRASLWIKSWPLIPGLVGKSVREWAAGNENAELLSESGEAGEAHLEITLSENFGKLRMSTKLIYCDAQTYEVTGVSSENYLEQYRQIFEGAHASVMCLRTDKYPTLESGALGMVITPPAGDEDDFFIDYLAALDLAREHGVQVSHFYFHWGDIEVEPGVYDWTVPDYIVEANALEGLQLSIVISLIHTTVRGRIPEGLTGLPFDDPLFVERLSSFLVAFSDRYSGTLKYLAIGNEVNDYFVNHRDEIPAYTFAFENARNAIHSVHPDLAVGMIFAYHDAERLNTIDIIQQLNLGDYVAYTFYLYNDGFLFQRDPGEINAYLDRMIELAEGTPIVITETGWSTAPELDGSENGQAEYIRQLFLALSERRDKIGFVTWFILHDGRRETCEKDSLTFFESGTEPDLNSPEMQTFVTFLCHFGLRNADGTPKQSWDVWTQEVQEYYP